MDSIKGALLSKTVWFNGALIALSGIDWLQSHGGVIAAVIPQASPILAVVGAIGIILRFITKTPLDEKINKAPVEERGFEHNDSQ